jgi:Tol biopolymer transport system component
VAPQSSPLIASTYQDREAQYSPDGTRIAFISTRSGQPAVWRSDSDGGNQVLIGSVDQGVPGSPRWTPDGQHVLFDASVPGTGSDIFMVPAEGGTPKPVVGGSAHEILGVMSPDSRWLYYSKNGEIWKLAPNGGAPMIVVRARAARLLPSDDGLWLYFSRGNDVWRVPTKGGGESLVKVGVHPASWTLRGSVLYELRGISGTIASTNGDNVTLTAYDTTTRATRELYRFATPRRLFSAKALDISPDGRWALVSQVTREESDLVVVDGLR